MLIALVGLNANAAMYIVGEEPLGGWAFDGGTLMTDNGDGTYTYKATFDKTVWFVFADGQGTSWDDFNGNYRYGPVSGGNEVVDANTDYTTQKSTDGNASYQFKGTGHEYTFIFDSNSMKFRVEGIVDVPTSDTYTVAGSSLELFGTSWDATNTNNDMTLVNGLYTFTKNNVELTTAGFSFKVVYNHDWGVAYPSSNFVQAIPQHGYYNVVITFDATTKEITCTPSLIQGIDGEDDIYTVAGEPAALFGTEWAPSLVENEMTKGQDGKYTWTKNAVELTAGNIEFKVVMGHAWGQEWPSSNYVATIEENGIYDVVITFDPETKDITFEATASVITDDYYIVAGYPMEIFGDEWNEDYAPNTMALVDGLYTWTKANVELAEGDTIEFKVVKNSNWDFAWPEMNYQYVCQTAGTYNLTITYDPETNDVVLNVTQPGEPAEITSYTVVGPTAIFGSEWNATDVNNDMTLGENGVYTWTKANVTLTGDFSFKVVGNHDYAVYEWPMGFANNYDVTVEEAGIYTIAITFDPNAVEDARITCTLTKTGDITPIVRGDADGNGVVGMDDLTAMINYLVYGTPVSDGAAICDDLESTAVTMDDLTALINYLVYGTWPAEPVVEHVYTVAGTENLFGSNWNPADEANDMVKGNDGIYTWTKENVEFTEYATIEFKVVEDHSWDNSAWPSSNWWAEITEPGMYNFVITFDPTADDMSKITYTATKQVVE